MEQQPSLSLLSFLLPGRSLLWQTGHQVGTLPY